MEINRLSQDELTYELKVRGLPPAKVDDMRSTLREALRAERAGQSLLVDPYPCTWVEDSDALTKKIEEIRALVDIFEGESSTPDFRKINTKIEWGLGRLARAKPEGDEQKKEAARIRANLVLALGALQIKADGGYDEEDTSDAEVNLSIPGQVMARSNARVPIYKWELKFTGDPSQSLNSFLDRVDELAEARGYNKQQLFKSALDLFDGRALIWYRANKSNFHSWSDLVRELRKEFLPFDYDDRLLEEIKKRTQGNGETIGLYIAVMKGMFGRLTNPLSEEQQLKVLKRNISPFYQTQMGLIEVDTIKELAELGRKLESVRTSVEAYAPPPSRRNHQLLEPDLAYVATEPTISSIVSRDAKRGQPGNSKIKCFRCHRFGHTARSCRKEVSCYGCGSRGVTRTNCANCSPSREQPGPSNRGEAGQPSSGNRGEAGQPSSRNVPESQPRQSSGSIQEQSSRSPGNVGRARQ